jgi:DNA methylase.
MPKRPIHCYAASFGNDLARKLISDHAEPGQKILDCFSGSGTTLIEALSAGHPAIGIDVDPIAILISRVLTQKYTESWLTAFLRETLAQLGLLEMEVISAVPDLRVLRRGLMLNVNGYLALIPDQPEVEFWFSASQRAALAGLTAYAGKISDVRKRRILRVAISSAIVRKWPNTLSRAMDVDHSRPHRADPPRTTIAEQFKLFKRIFTDVVNGLKAMIPTMENWSSNAEIIQGDSVSRMRTLARNSVGLVLSSPPYVDAIDYPRAHKFSEWWLNPFSLQCKRENYVGLRRLDESTLTAEALELAPTTMQTLAWLEKSSPAKYRLVCRYVLDMAQVIRGCRRVLRESGKLVFVLADNKLEGRSVPIVRITEELLRVTNFQRVASVRRRIKNGRRRYPFGFNGVMKSEAIITAAKA